MGFWGSNPIGNQRSCLSWKRKQSWSSIFLLFRWDTATAFWFVCFPLNYFRKNNNASKTRNSNYQLDSNVSMYKFWPCTLTIVKLSKHCDNRHAAPSTLTKKLTLNLINSLELIFIYKNIKDRGTSKITLQGRMQTNLEWGYSIRTTDVVSPASQWQGKWRWREDTALDFKRPNKNINQMILWILIQIHIHNQSITFVYRLNIK